VGDLHTLLPSADQTSKQKINKDILKLNNTMGKIGWADIFRVFYPKEAHYTLFSAAHKIFFKIDYILSHKASLNKYEKCK
jgi:exonuclease III